MPRWASPSPCALKARACSGVARAVPVARRINSAFEAFMVAPLEGTTLHQPPAQNTSSRRLRSIQRRRSGELGMDAARLRQAEHQGAQQAAANLGVGLQEREKVLGVEAQELARLER